MYTPYVRIMQRMIRYLNKKVKQEETINSNNCFAKVIRFIYYVKEENKNCN